MNAPVQRRRVLIKSWGCQMNVYDASRMADILAPLGYMRTDDPADADLVILYTCHIREKASEKLFSDLGRLNEHKTARAAQGLATLITVGGCVAQAMDEAIKERAPYVDLIFGPQTYHRLPEMLARAAKEKDTVLETDFPPEPKFDFLPRAHGAIGVGAFLPIQEGCDRFCSYCVVPYTRGAEYSRALPSILEEAVVLAEAGAREITLLGQNVNAYRDPSTGAGLADVLEALHGIEGIMRLRYTTSHPLDVTPDLIAAHAYLPKVMPFLHLPLQSGSDRILEAMNRKHSAAHYSDVVAALRRARPDIALSSDFIVGFPGETEEDFEATMAMVRKVGYAQAFSFKYSRRPGTPAAALQDQIPESVKKERLMRLQELLREQQTAFNATCEGKTLHVLFESISDDRQGCVFGRTPFMQTVRVRGDQAFIGQEREILIVKASPNSLTGETI